MAVKKTLHLLYDKRHFNRYDSADEVLKDCLYFEADKGRRLDLDPIKGVVSQGFYSKIMFKKASNIKRKILTYLFFYASQ